MIKYLVTGTIMGLIAATVNAKDMASFSGTWKPVGTSEINLFTGDIFITQVKKRTPGFYTLIYDKNKHGLACFYVSEGNYSVCMPVVLNKDKITPDDKIDDVMTGALMESTMFVKGVMKAKKLTLSIAPMGSDCTNPMTCVFKELSVYQKK